MALHDGQLGLILHPVCHTDFLSAWLLSQIGIFAIISHAHSISGGRSVGGVGPECRRRTAFDRDWQQRPNIRHDLGQSVLQSKSRHLPNHPQEKSLSHFDKGKAARLVIFLSELLHSMLCIKFDKIATLRFSSKISTSCLGSGAAVVGLMEAITYRDNTT